MTLEIWLTFIAASSVLLLIPGPTILLVLSYSLSHGRSVAIATVAGVALGDLLAMTISLVGLGALVLASAQLFNVLKWLGAIYLIFLGIQLLRSAENITIDRTVTVAQTTSKSVFSHAAIVTLLNPKSIVFFIAFVPQFVNIEQPLIPQFIILIITFVSLAAINALAYAILADHLRQRISRPNVLPRLTRLGGCTLILMGLLTALYKRPTIV